MRTRYNATRLHPDVPDRGPVVGRTVLVMVGALLLAGIVGGLMALFGGDPTSNETGTTAKDWWTAIGAGMLVGLAAFFVMLVPVIITTALTKDFMTQSDLRARLVSFLLWLGGSLGVVAAMSGWLGREVTQGLALLWPSALLVLVVTQLLAPWTVWKRWRRPAADL